MSGLSQDPLWVDPPWTSHFPVGSRVRSTYTQNTGTVTAVDHLGRHLWIKWEGTFWRDAEACRHHSERGLERLP